MSDDTFKPTKPKYKLKVRFKQPEYKDFFSNSGDIGAAWEGKNGALHIHLNPLVVLRQMDDLQITLFPNNWKEPETPITR